MSSREYRSSLRIPKLEARSAQKALNKKLRNMSLGNSGCRFSQRQRRRKAKIQFNHASNIKAANSGGAFPVSSNTPLPQPSALELLLDMLKRRDSLKIFAEPVNSTEVEGYYDIVKDPMDFAKISTKLSRGIYKMLEDFEHDVFLVFSNATLSNSCKTVYYRQARAISGLAKKLFAALRADANNFEIKFSLARQATDRWTKAEARLINTSSCNQPKNVATRKVSVSAGARTYEGFERRTTFQPQTSHPNKNAAFISTVLDAPGSAKSFVQINQSSLGYGLDVSYRDSLLKFTRGLGPVAQMVAQRKLHGCSCGSLTRGYVSIHHPCQVCYQEQVPRAASLGSRMLPSVYQNSSRNPVGAFDEYSVSNHQHQQLPCTTSPGSAELCAVYQNPFGSPVRAQRHNENAERDDLDFGSTPTSNEGDPSMSDDMSFDDEISPELAIAS